MLSTLLFTIEILKTVVYYSFLLSWQTGKFIITAGKLLLNGLTTLTEHLSTTLKVFFEDFRPFSRDVLQHFYVILDGLTLLTEHLYTGVLTIVETANAVIRGMVLSVFYIFNTVNNIVLSVAGTIIELFAFLKRVLILFGSGMWFLITLIPFSIVYWVVCSTYYLGLLFKEINNIVSTLKTETISLTLNIYEFVTDVPIESLIGLSILMCLVYLLLQFHVALYQFLHQKLITFVELTRSAFTLRHSLNITAGSQEAADSTDSEQDEEFENNYCVICHERGKSILLLPCKHVCLCPYCQQTFRNYDYKCPICRTPVQKTMRVYI